MSIFKLSLRAYILLVFYLFLIIVLQFIHIRSSLANASSPVVFNSVQSEQAKLLPTATFTPIPTSVIIPTRQPTYVPTGEPTAIPTLFQQPVSSGNGSVDVVNAYRGSKGLSALSSDGIVCGFASTRASEIATDFSHNGFVSRRDGGSLPYPSYSAVVENIAMSGDGQTAVDMWKGSPTHDANLLGDFTHGCIANNGSFFVFEGWKN